MHKNICQKSYRINPVLFCQLDRPLANLNPDQQSTVLYKQSRTTYAIITQLPSVKLQVTCILNYIIYKNHTHCLRLRKQLLQRDVACHLWQVSYNSCGKWLRSMEWCTTWVLEYLPSVLQFTK